MADALGCESFIALRKPMTWAPRLGRAARRSSVARHAIGIKKNVQL